VQEFQIATDRFGADLGRTASSVINVRHALGHEYQPSTF
jgi:hypothetical protein